jgi:cytochrome P450
MDLGEIDLASHDSFWHGVPHHWFTALREQAPMYRHPAPADGSLPEFWNATRHADIARISLDPATFTSSKGVSLLQLQSFDTTLLEMMPDFLILTDPPEHTAIRRIISSSFTPRRTAQLEEGMRRVARDAVARVADAGECDFVELAAELPIRVIADILGIPREDHHLLYDWTTRTFGVEDPDCSASKEDFFEAFMETFAYANQICEAKRSHPTDDILSALVTAEVDGVGLTESQLLLFFYLLTAAGNETTRTLIMQGMHLLLERPELERQLREDRTLLPAAIDEMLRICSPVHHMARTATRDVEMHGQQIKAGDLIALWYVSGNRDPEVFPDPERVDLHRSAPVLHQAFGGGGPHYCLGASLARVEARVMFDEIFNGLVDIEQAGPATRLRSNFSNGLKSLPIRYKAA